MKDDRSRSTIRNVKLENPNVVLPFKTYTVKDGLIGNRIRALMQDVKGFLWIGTTDGLSIYDGSKFKNYSETNGLRIGSIVTIYESKFETGTVWVSQSSGEILKIKDEHITIYKCENTDKKNFAFCFYEDSKGVLWCGTRYGLYYLKGNKFSKVNTNQNFESVKNIYRYSDSSIIFVSDLDCYLFDTNNYSIKLIELNINKLKEYTIDSIIDEDGDLWIGIIDGSIIHLKNLRVNARYKMGTRYMQPSLSDNNGNIWVSDVNGLIKFNKSENVSRAVLYKPENGLPGKGFRAM
ncbi:MAG: two-component regulator propeller domain-containing protein, partial [Ignavibacteria bacterium]|nr:two-component regulator propeller domain-containing protein [Ignavibacteria bacterium]